MFANVSGVPLKNSSIGYWAFAKRFFACEINFHDRLFGFSFLFRFWLALLEFEADVFLVVQHEKRFEWSALAGNKALEQICPTGGEQFLHLFRLDRPLQDDFARSEIAGLVRAD